jgi:hypothetical protein
MERIVLERTTPVQGQVVTVKVSSANGSKGEFTLSFFEWLHFSKLLKAGMEYQKGRDEQRVEVVIVGKDQAVPEPKLSLLAQVGADQERDNQRYNQPKQKPLPKVAVTDDEVNEFLLPSRLESDQPTEEESLLSRPRSLRGDDNASND